MGRKQAVLVNDIPENHNLAVLGHELGNVLHGLLGMAELLGESELTPEQFQLLRAIEHSGQQMASLMQTTCSREPSTTPCTVPRHELIDGIELLEHVVVSHTPAARKGNNRLVLLVDPALPRFWRLDPCLVRQLLDNLVGNANKFTRSGQIVVEASCAIDECRGQESVRLRVSDSGTGFEPSVAEHLFGAYRHFGDSSETATGNRGLGLYICQQIADAMNGRLSCGSAAGGGAFFEVVLPGIPDHEFTKTPEFRSRLFDVLECRLQLPGVLRISVENFLGRLGVQFSDDEEERKPASGQVLELLISEKEASDFSQSRLLLTALPECGAQTRKKALRAPVLESSLARLMLEFALDWRCRQLRNESPGSAPRPL